MKDRKLETFKEYTEAIRNIISGKFTGISKASLVKGLKDNKNFIKDCHRLGLSHNYVVQELIV